LYELGTRSNIQNKLYDEIKQNLANGDNLNEDTLSKLHYLKAFVKETLRFVLQ
jgi:hypothetical protein